MQVLEKPVEVKVREGVRRLVKPVEVKSPPSEAELFCEVADVLERGGWIKGQSEDGYGNHCLAGAIIYVAERHFGGDHRVMTDVHASMVMRAMGVIQFLHPEFGSMSVTHFNDAPGTTKEMVLEVVRKAGDCAEGS